MNGITRTVCRGSVRASIQTARPGVYKNGVNREQGLPVGIDLTMGASKHTNTRRSRWVWLVAAAALVIAAVVGGIALRTALNNAREDSLRVQCLSNMRYLGVAFAMYRQENDGYMPPADQRQDGYFWVPYILGDEDNQHPRYFGMPAIMLLCYSHIAREGRDAFPWEGDSGDQAMPYLRAEPERCLRYVGEPLLAGRRYDSVPDPSAVVMLWEDGPYHEGGRFVCHLDASAQWLDEGAFAEALARSRSLLTSPGAEASQ